MLVFTLGLGVLAMSDVYWRVLPKNIVNATWVGGLAGLAVAAGLEDRWSDFVTSATAGITLFVVLAALHLAVPHHWRSETLASQDRSPALWGGGEPPPSFWESSPASYWLAWAPSC